MKKIIEIPDDVADKFEQQNYKMSVEQNQIVLKSDVDQLDAQNFSLHYMLIPSLLSLVISLLTFFLSGHSQINFTGGRYHSVAGISMLCATIIGFATFLWVYSKQNTSPQKRMLSRIRELVTISLAYTLIVFAIQALIWYILGMTFVGVTLDRFTASFVAALFSAIVFYFLILFAASVKISHLIILLFITFIGGIFLSMATNGQNGWWQYNFSFLGTGEAKNQWQFNFTMIFSALMLLTITDYLFMDFQKSDLYNFKVKIVQAFYYVIALFIAGVGIFPAQSWTMTFHNASAYGIVLCIIILIVLSKYLLPQISKEFLSMSAIVFVALVTSAILFLKVHYLSLTVFEIIAFAISFTWLVLMINALQKMLHESSIYQVKVVQLKEEI
ncbi:DUF998 domain-containing protein [Lactococcus petauri]|uniref:DUF998 domain-containing protein n=1 Tax=Lactococcus petauri TaxID=1940789 RepID=UPI00232E76A7|nr:DUF998 domain-containing protein [Lactococcus petauri]MDC0815107.1 DUF998 domain-containing protein [Lactococcus petauri]MDC0817172.1 DUF998 domain-containing protein [Lactococcus petauri]MDC0823590.1 DUF998 domain-containing protein [Lactococcus petauri]MDC0829692.1 DUF998 domain-containing protein [Lactococcus petauri]